MARGTQLLDAMGSPVGSMLKCSADIAKKKPCPACGVESSRFWLLEYEPDKAKAREVFERAQDKILQMDPATRREEPKATSDPPSAKEEKSRGRGTTSELAEVYKKHYPNAEASRLRRNSKSTGLQDMPKEEVAEPPEASIFRETRQQAALHIRKKGVRICFDCKRQIEVSTKEDTRFGGKAYREE
jgi:hypothetical protein